MKSPKEIEEAFRRLQEVTEQEVHMEQQMRANRKLRKKIQTQSGKVRMLEHLLELSEKQYDVLAGLLNPSDWKPSTVVKPDMRFKNEATAIALYSDIHCEKKILPETCNNWNESNPSIIEKRHLTWENGLLKVTREQRKSIPIPHLVLFILGDLITGYLWEEDIEDNYYSPTEAIDFAQHMVVHALKKFSEDGDFKTIRVVMVRGNHGRTSNRKKYATAHKNSYEQQMYYSVRKLFTEQLVGYNNLEFIIPKSEFAEVQIYDKKVTGSHGDHFRYQGGIGGLEIPMRKWGYKLQEAAPADKRYIGHWHHRMPGDKEVVNGSGCGYDAFAMGHGFSPEPPMMHYELLDRNRNLFTVQLPIIMDKLLRNR